MKPHPKILIFYDGDCGFCQWWVQFFLKKNPGNFYFAPLQGKTAQDFLQPNQIQKLQTLIVLTEDQQELTKSLAAFYLMRRCESFGAKFFAGLGLLFPTFLSDWVYQQIAKNRHKLNQKNCLVPSEEEKKFLLD